MKHIIVTKLPETLTPNTTYYVKDVNSGVKRYKQYIIDKNGVAAEQISAAGIYESATLNNILPNRGLTNEGPLVPSDIINTSSEPINIDNLRALDPTIPANATTVNALKAAGLKFDNQNKLIPYNAPTSRFTGYNSITGDLYVQAMVGDINTIDSKWIQKYPTQLGGRQNLYIGHSFDNLEYYNLSTFPDVKKSMFIGMNNAPYFQDGSALIIMGTENLYNSGGAEPKSRIIAGRDSIVVGYNNYKGTSDHTNTGINKQRILFASIFGDNNAAFAEGHLNSTTLIGSRNYYKSSGGVVESNVVGRNNGQFDKKDLRYANIIGVHNFNADTRKFTTDLGNIQYVNKSSSSDSVYSNIPWFTPYYINKIGAAMNSNGSISLPANATLNLVNNPIIIGKMNLRSFVNTSVGSIWIGNNNGSFSGTDTTFYGNDMNNIVIGNLNVGRDAIGTNNKHDVYNNIIIGSRINLKGENNKLVIGHLNDYSSNTPNMIPANEFLLYGDFVQRTLKINGNLSINPTLNVGNDEFTKQVVAKPDGTLGLVDKGGSDGASDVIKTKDDTDYVIQGTTTPVSHIVGPDINIKGGKWVNVKITLNVKSEINNKKLSFTIIPKNKPYNINKVSTFKVTNNTANAFNSINLRGVTNTQQDLNNTNLLAITQTFIVTGTDYTMFDIAGSVYLNEDNVVNLVLFLEQNTTNYKMFIENIKVELE